MSLNYWQDLERRREGLGIEFPALSSRAGVSQSTLKRLLSGKLENPTIHSLQAVCVALGVELHINGTIKVFENDSAQQYREKQAQEKAEQLVRLVQGTSALESQAVGPDVVRDMVSQTVHKLLAGSDRRLWAA